MKKFLKEWDIDPLSYLLFSFLLWFAIAGVYGAGSVNDRSNPLYNTPQQETMAVLVYIPIFSLLWPLWLYLFFEFGKALDWLFKTNLHPRFGWVENR
ncbi:MAG TPA: hypothetical protein VJI33_00440 [Candidatus Paceibacterota bacterium]